MKSNLYFARDAGFPGVVVGFIQQGGERLEAPHPEQGKATANTGFTAIIVVSIAAPIVVTNNTNASESFLFIKIF